MRLISARYLEVATLIRRGASVPPRERDVILETFFLLRPLMETCGSASEKHVITPSGVRDG